MMISHKQMTPQPISQKVELLRSSNWAKRPVHYAYSSDKVLPWVQSVCWCQLGIPMAAAQWGEQDRFESHYLEQQIWGTTQNITIANGRAKIQANLSYNWYPWIPWLNISTFEDVYLERKMSYP